MNQTNVSRIYQEKDRGIKAITKHGGEILKFIGDGLLAIFPVLGPDDAARAAEGALSAGRETLEALKAYRAPEQGAPLRIVIALHYGTVIYGNIGAADRLDFTVIGPASISSAAPKRLRNRWTNRWS